MKSGMVAWILTVIILAATVVLLLRVHGGQSMRHMSGGQAEQMLRQLRQPQRPPPVRPPPNRQPGVPNLQDQ